MEFTLLNLSLIRLITSLPKSLLRFLILKHLKMVKRLLLETILMLKFGMSGWLISLLIALPYMNLLRVNFATIMRMTAFSISSVWDFRLMVRKSYQVFTIKSFTLLIWKERPIYNFSSISRKRLNIDL